jgi:hypothetical protein
MLLHGIDSNILKNSKSRVNNIEEIGRLVSTVGHRQLFSNTKQIAALAQNLDERKGGVREATLETLAALWRSMNAAGGGKGGGNVSVEHFVAKNHLDRSVSQKGIDMLKGRLEALMRKEKKENNHSSGR